MKISNDLSFFKSMHDGKPNVMSYTTLTNINKSHKELQYECICCSVINPCHTSRTQCSYIYNYCPYLINYNYLPWPFVTPFEKGFETLLIEGL